jgi:hypothetical protein
MAGSQTTPDIFPGTGVYSAPGAGCESDPGTGVGIDPGEKIHAGAVRGAQSLLRDDDRRLYQQLAKNSAIDRSAVA